MSSTTSSPNAQLRFARTDLSSVRDTKASSVCKQFDKYFSNSCFVILFSDLLVDCTAVLLFVSLTKAVSLTTVLLLIFFSDVVFSVTLSDFFTDLLSLLLSAFSFLTS